MKDLVFIGGAVLILAIFGGGQLALNGYAEKQELRNQIEALEQQNRDLTNQLLGTLSN